MQLAGVSCTQRGICSQQRQASGAALHCPCTSCSGHVTGIAPHDVRGWQDLKSPNILLAGQKLSPYVLNAKIADVGLSRMARNGYLSNLSKVPSGPVVCC